MENTRVFVSGLPPTLSNEDLGKHFSSRFSVTDAHVIPKRRIGFVGFKSAEAAKQAADYFNRTFIRMSKISVEIARPVKSDNTETAQAAAEKAKKGSKPDESLAANSLKRKRDENNTQQDAKLQEYLSLTQNTKKRTWANDDGIAETLTSVNTNGQSVDVEHPVDDVSQAQRKKTKVEAAALSKNKEPVQGHVQHTTVLQPASKSPVDGEADDQGGKDEEMAEDPAQAEPKSDADWLRSKTSRLLGLLDEEEQAEHDTAPPPSRFEPVEDDDDDDDGPQSGGVALDNATSIPTADADGDADMATPANQEEIDANVELIRNSARLFVRNLPYDATEADLDPIFSPFGKIEEIHVAFDTRSTTSKGFAYVQYVDASSAIDAYKALDGKTFQGRLLHILPASAKKTYKIDEYELSKLPLKKQKQIKRKMEASSSTFSWNSLYMNADAVMSSVAERLGVSKAELLDPTSADAAIKQAHAETHVIQETKAYFTSNGVNLDAFKKKERGNTAILVKNFSFGVKAADLRKLFEQYGKLTRLLMPPSGTIAIVEFANPDEAQKAFKGLAYRKLGDSILFLERAPKDLFDSTTAPQQAVLETKAVSQGFSTADTFAAEDTQDQLPTSTLFVRNLNFATTTARLAEIFQPLDGFLSAKVKTKPDPKRPGQTLSMGFGFVEFRTSAQAQAALAAMNGYKLDQHELVIKASHKGMDAAEERRREDTAKKIAARRTKIIIKNLPFQATKKDVRSLFGAYGQLRSVRVPKKFDHSARGFAFADFVSAREAENAMDALKNTHLLGRRLVLEFASEEAVDPEAEIQKIEKKVGEQVDRVRIQKLTGTGRKKFTVGAQDDEEV
ncbi:pre-rRNA processing protein Mrd1, putative [Paecilomyces variotii No. 5]|uniref:Multiple RNA-binding domain-containing protein 1 n=1 Tax=Byssochlamys spectabilis (strain No. 5 / NBRC 109023) TaxID=1356009 RepID=V5FT06_BYSSN|nr:pre-rRNA processing protein Mrd1, putative [Paecilomyces variotii No. 5]